MPKKQQKIGFDTNDTVSAARSQVPVSGSSFTELRASLETFPKLPFAADLINAMEADPKFCWNEPDPVIINFLTTIETADPAACATDDDELSSAWGHDHYRAAGFIAEQLPRSWAEVGNTDVARRLIAGVINTTQVARQICKQKKLPAPSFIADLYLEMIIERIWNAWKAAGGEVSAEKRNETEDTTATMASIQRTGSAPSSAPPSDPTPRPTPVVSAAKRKPRKSARKKST